MLYFQLAILFLLTAGASFLAFIIHQPIKKYLNPVLIFSGAYLLGITILHFLPELFNSQVGNPALFILLGFALQIVLEMFSKGIEHGHLHVHDPGRFFPYSVAIGLGVHAFIEGIPLTTVFLDKNPVGIEALYFGILIHKLPAAFVLLAVMLNFNVSSKKALTILLVFAAMTPLGAIMSQLFYTPLMGHQTIVFNTILAMVVGAFLHISTTILFETGEKHQYSNIKIAGILVGFFVAFLTTYL